MAGSGHTGPPFLSNVSGASAPWFQDFGFSIVASTALIAEMPELGAITGEEDVALAGLAPVAHDSGTLRGKRAIAGGRRALRHVMFQATLLASHLSTAA